MLRHDAPVDPHKLSSDAVMDIKGSRHVVGRVRDRPFFGWLYATENDGVVHGAILRKTNGDEEHIYTITAQGHSGVFRRTISYEKRVTTLHMGTEMGWQLLSEAPVSPADEGGPKWTVTGDLEECGKTETISGLRCNIFLSRDGKRRLWWSDELFITVLEKKDSAIVYQVLL